MDDDLDELFDEENFRRTLQPHRVSVFYARLIGLLVCGYLLTIGYFTLTGVEFLPVTCRLVHREVCGEIIVSEQDPQFQEAFNFALVFTLYCSFPILTLVSQMYTIGSLCFPVLSVKTKFLKLQLFRFTLIPLFYHVLLSFFDSCSLLSVYSKSDSPAALSSYVKTSFLFLWNVLLLMYFGVSLLQSEYNLATAAARYRARQDAPNQP